MMYLKIFKKENINHFINHLAEIKIYKVKKIKSISNYYNNNTY